MKKMILMMAIGAIAFQSNAQDNKIYLKGGFNLANVSVSDNGAIEDANSLASFHAGLMADLPLGGGILSFQPGILFTGKGAKWQSGSETSSN